MRRSSTEEMASERAAMAYYEPSSRWSAYPFHVEQCCAEIVKIDIAAAPGLGLRPETETESETASAVGADADVAVAVAVALVVFDDAAHTDTAHGHSGVLLLH